MQWGSITDTTSKVGRLDIIDMGCQDNTVNCPTIPGIDNSTYLYFVGSQGSGTGIFIYRALKSDPMLPANWSAYNAGTWDSNVQNATDGGNSTGGGATCCQSYSYLPGFGIFVQWQYVAAGVAATDTGIATASTIFGAWTQRADMLGTGGANVQFPTPVAGLYHVVAGRIVQTMMNNTGSPNHIQMMEVDMGPAGPVLGVVQ
jgi:hypothetical protein